MTTASETETETESDGQGALGVYKAGEMEEEDPVAGGLTHVGEVVDEDDLLEQLGRRAVQDAVHGAEQHGPRLVVEAHHHAGVRQHAPVLQVQAPASTHRDSGRQCGGQ